MRNTIIIPMFFTLIVVLSGFYPSALISAINPQLTELRQELPVAFEDEKKCEVLYIKFKDVKSSDPIERIYRSGLYCPV